MIDQSTSFQELNERARNYNGQEYGNDATEILPPKENKRRGENIDDIALNSEETRDAKNIKKSKMSHHQQQQPNPVKEDGDCWIETRAVLKSPSRFFLQNIKMR